MTEGDQTNLCASYDDLSGRNHTDCVILQCASADRSVTDLSGHVTIYVIGKDERMHQSLRLVSNLTGYQLEYFDSCIDFLSVYKNGLGCLILNGELNEMDGLQFAQKLPGLKISLPVIIIADIPDVFTSVTLTEDVIGFVSMSCHVEKLVSIVCAAVGKMQIERGADSN